MTGSSCELNLDGLPGPTHHFAGLSPGNLASIAHRHQPSNPRAAAHQALAKMKMVADLGVPQAVLPPHERPAMDVLRRFGFTGDDASVLASAQRDAPDLLGACCSASSMWAANAATVSPSADSADARVHFTPANLVMELHRSLEPRTTSALLRRIFPDETHFAHHAPLPAAYPMRDEGAANHTRLCVDYDGPGIQLFVYGARAFDQSAVTPRHFAARQTDAASRALSRLHRLDAERVCFAQQHPDAIDAGVFHNDVAAVGDRNVFLCHVDAFLDADTVITRLQEAFRRYCDNELRVMTVTSDMLSLDEAVRTYLFNSQIVRDSNGETVLIAPVECRESAAAPSVLDMLCTGDAMVQRVQYVDLRESMHNGGGPACLRLRVALNAAELAAVHNGVMLNDALYQRLTAWVDRHYRDRLVPADLADPQLLAESRAALDELTQILQLGSVYPFQCAGA